MADAYGAVVLSRSDDCIIDEQKLLAQLNALRWSNDNAKWALHDDHSFWFDTCQYPTVCHRMPVTLNYTDEDGTIKSVPYADATQEQLDAEYDIEDAVMPLSEISKHFDECVLRGSITIAAACNEKSRYVQYETLLIESDGCVALETHFVGITPHYNTSHSFEEYSRF